ncbi:MAG: IS66 family transposase [Gammaproteobacteria bacterium]
MVAALRAENEQLRRDVGLLQQRLEELLRQTYGRKSEKFNPDQLPLFRDGPRSPDEPAEVDPADETPDYEEPPAGKQKKKRGPHPGRAPLPAHLERRIEHHDLEDRTCPCCGEQMEPAGEEVSEELGMEPARFFVRRRIRHKYACRHCQDAVVRADLPPVAIEKCQAGSDVLSAIVVSKYADHLPLNRQQAIYRREGVELSRVTMCHWIGQCAFLLKPIVEQMKSELLHAAVVQSDDTVVKYLEPPGPAKRGYLWAYVSSDGDVVYDFTTDRSRDGPSSFLAGFLGVVQVDGYQGYNEVLGTEGVIHAACWAHVRRKFEHALQAHPEEAGIVLQRIQAIYRVEEEIRQLEPAPNPEQIAAIRRRNALPAIEKLKEYLTECRQRVLPQSPLGQAIDYAFGQWPWLTTYIENGLVEIDNNSCERAMRKPAVGRKNWLFGGSEQGGYYAATLYSLIETCARAGINPHAYLTDVLVRVGTHPQSRIAELTPRAWAAARARSATS